MPGWALLAPLRSPPRESALHMKAWAVSPSRKGTAWNNYLYFRDTLLSSPETAAEYDALKLDLAERFSNDRQAYTKAKESFITGILNNRK